MKKSEKEQLKNEIQMKNEMTRKIAGWSRKSLVIFIVMSALVYWGFSGMNDTFITVSNIVRDIVKWIALLLSILSGLFAIMTFLSFRNSKKHVLGLIDKLQKN